MVTDFLGYIYIYIYIPKYSPSSLRPWWLAATLRQVHNKSTTSWHVKMLWICCTAFDLLWICCRHFDLLWICCTTSCTTNPQQNRISGVWALCHVKDTIYNSLPCSVFNAAVHLLSGRLSCRVMQINYSAAAAAANLNVLRVTCILPFYPPQCRLKPSQARKSQGGSPSDLYGMKVAVKN